MDTGNHMIVDFEVINNCNDVGLLYEGAQRVKKGLEAEILEVVFYYKKLQPLEQNYFFAYFYTIILSPVGVSQEPSPLTSRNRNTVFQMPQLFYYEHIPI